MRVFLPDYQCSTLLSSAHLECTHELRTVYHSVPYGILLDGVTEKLQKQRYSMKKIPTARVFFVFVF